MPLARTKKGAKTDIYRIHGTLPRFGGVASASSNVYTYVDIKWRFSNIRGSVKSPKASFSDVSESDLTNLRRRLSV